MSRTHAEAIYRPTGCEFIEGEPTADDRCKCGRTLWRPGAAFCAAHHKRVYRSERHDGEGAPDPHDDEPEEARRAFDRGRVVTGQAWAQGRPEPGRASVRETT